MFKIFFQSKFFTALAVFVVFLLSLSLVRVWPARVETEKQLNILRGKIAETESSNSEIKKFSDYFKSPTFLEREAKIKLNVRKPDENVIFVYENPNGNNTPESGKKSLSGPEDMANFQKWVNYLFKK